MKKPKLIRKRRNMTKRRIAEARKRLILFLATLFGAIIILGVGHLTNVVLAEQSVIEPIIIQHIETIPEMITRKAIENNVNPEDALRVIQCESELNPLAKNANSSASGLAQFISKTWINYCKGDVFNAEDNAQCFMELYPSHPSWWLCK